MGGSKGTFGPQRGHCPSQSLWNHDLAPANDGEFNMFMALHGKNRPLWAVSGGWSYCHPERCIAGGGLSTLIFCTCRALQSYTKSSSGFTFQNFQFVLWPRPRLGHKLKIKKRSSTNLYWQLAQHSDSHSEAHCRLVYKQFRFTNTCRHSIMTASVYFWQRNEKL